MRQTRRVGSGQAGVGDGEHLQERVQAAAELYDLGRPVEPVRLAARGQMGVVWLLVTDRGRFAVKQLLTSLDEDAVATEAGLLSEMVRRGVPAPVPLRTADGRVL